MDYVNNLYDINISQNETLSYSVDGDFFETFYAFTPEYYAFNDGNRKGLSLISFKAGKPYMHNLSSTTTYDTFYDTETDFIVRIVCNAGEHTEKRFQTIALRSRNTTSAINSPKYFAESVLTSDNQESSIPMGAFKFKENWEKAVFYRALNNGGTLQTGSMLRGTWVECNLIRDTEIRTEYSELSDMVFEFFTSEKTTI